MNTLDKNFAMPSFNTGNSQSSFKGSYQDVASLDNLRREAQTDEKKALEKVAKQFEGIFMKMLLKSMREANKAFQTDSPLNSQDSEMYRNMHDDQMAMELSENGSLGLAELIVQQLSPQATNVMPSSALRGKGLPMVASHSADVTARNINKAATKVNSQVTETSNAEPHFSSAADFVKQMMPYAEKAAQVLGGSATVFIAQAALETGWGQKIVSKGKQESSFNLFNIKADKRWEGESAKTNTLEFKDGIAVKQRAQFRAYEGFKESFEDFTNFIKDSSRYQPALEKVSNPARFLHGLQQAGYATDPNYAKKILSVLNRVNDLVNK